MYHKLGKSSTTVNLTVSQPQLFHNGRHDRFTATTVPQRSTRPFHSHNCSTTVDLSVSLPQLFHNGRLVCFTATTVPQRSTCRFHCHNCSETTQKLKTLNPNSTQNRGTDNTFFRPPSKFGN